MKLLIIRHGEPDYEHDSLTEKGFREADLLALRMEKIKPDDAYVSPLGRARDTARPSLKALHMEEKILPWLQEFRGKVVDPKDSRWHSTWEWIPRYWTRNPELYDREKWAENTLIRTGNAEEIYRETCEGLDALLLTYGLKREGMIYRCQHAPTDTVALFCHSCIGLTMIGYLTGLAVPVLWHNFLLPTSSVTTLYTEERLEGEAIFRVFQMGDTGHLYAAGEENSLSGMYRETSSESLGASGSRC